MLSLIDDKRVTLTRYEAMHYALFAWGATLLLALAFAGSVILLNWMIRGNLGGPAWSWLGWWLGIAAGVVLVPVSLCTRRYVFDTNRDDVGVDPKAFLTGSAVEWTALWLWAMTPVSVYLYTGDLMPNLAVFIFALAGIALSWPKGYAMINPSVNAAGLSAQDVTRDAERHPQRRATTTASAAKHRPRQRTVRTPHRKTRPRGTQSAADANATNPSGHTKLVEHIDAAGKPGHMHTGHHV
ncbi:MAG: hypothetical protein GC159_24270 [Phycisphaera sp.]|nr:hypothetical protein [Phycisphaera sp.]